MLAVMWAKSHPGTPVVNIDGHGRRTVSQYDGLSEGDARSRIAEAEARVKASLHGVAISRSALCRVVRRFVCPMSVDASHSYLTPPVLSPHGRWMSLLVGAIPGLA